MSDINDRLIGFLLDQISELKRHNDRLMQDVMRKKLPSSEEHPPDWYLDGGVPWGGKHKLAP